MNILLLGSGGREHAIAWKLAASPLLTRLIIAPGNAGTALCGTNIPVTATDFENIRKVVLENQVDMVVVGPEDPLVMGIHDFFLADNELQNIPVIGPNRDAARLEGSKDFAKQFMIRHSIPTARFRTFDPSGYHEGLEFIRSLTLPIVLKADGLAAGKGVLICQSHQEAESEFSSMLVEQKFGEASRKVVIEEFLRGIELSVFILTDGEHYLLLPEAKDYKRIGEGDTGPNTGGMGSVSPVPFATPQFMQKVEELVIKPTVQGLKSEGIDYSGFIFFGLMNVDGNPFVIEYNCRLGDPETESVLPRIKNDLLSLFVSTAEKKLRDEILSIDPSPVATVMLVAQGYPGHYNKGKVITFNEPIQGSFVFHAGTGTDPLTGRTVTNGGRVMAISSVGETIGEALRTSYFNSGKIMYDGKTCRHDIGFDLY